MHVAFHSHKTCKNTHNLTSTHTCTLTHFRPLKYTTIKRVLTTIQTLNNNSTSLLNIMSFFHLADNFAYKNLKKFCSAVSSISEQINLFSVCVCACVCACVHVCKLRKLLICILSNFCIFNICYLSFKIYNICYSIP